MNPASKRPAVVDKTAPRRSRPTRRPESPGGLGGRGGYDVDDEVFFTHASGSPCSGRVVSHGAHGATVDDATGGRHQVTWDRVLALKGRRSYAARVVEQGAGGAIMEREDGTRFFCRGSAPGGDDADPLAFDDDGQAEDLQKADAVSRLGERIALLGCWPERGGLDGIALLWGRLVS